MTDAPPAIRTASPDERERATDTIVLAFASDPFCRWIWPEPRVYLDAWNRMIAPFGGRAFDEGTAWVTGSDEAAALWLAPGVEADSDAMGEILMSTIDPERAEAIGAVMEAMDEAHPKFEHWYLPIIGCDPAHIGTGLGGALMKHALARVDEDGLPAYLESSNPRNISLYQRHGFEIAGEIRIGDSPVMTPMLREARGQMAEKRFERHKQPWTSDEIQKLQRLAAKGMSRRAIAKALTRSEESVKARAKADGLKISKLH